MLSSAAVIMFTGVNNIIYSRLFSFIIFPLLLQKETCLRNVRMHCTMFEKNVRNFDVNTFTDTFRQYIFFDLNTFTNAFVDI